MPSRLIRTADDLDALFTLLGNLLGKKKPLTVDWVEGADRTAQQNKLMWRWASETGDQLGETADEVQRRWKLDHGLPILCVDSEDYRQFCRLTLGRLTREQRLKAMEFTPVTSEMNVKQMVRFMDTVERECVVAGVELTQPDSDLADYQRRNREEAKEQAA
jgi:hypothetical protein